MGSNPVLPRDMHPDLDLSRSENLQQLVEGLKTNAAKPAQQTSAHREPPVHVPEGLDQVTHVRVRRAKPGLLGHVYEGPMAITVLIAKRNFFNHTLVWGEIKSL